MMNTIRHFSALRNNCFFMAMAGGLSLSLFAGSAGAACNLTVSLANLQMGQMSAASLRAVSMPGYRSMGTKAEFLNATCDAPQAMFRLEFGGLVPAIGKPLLRWGALGAMQLRVAGASVAGLPVNLKLESAPASAYAQAVDVTHNDVLTLDVSHVPLQDRTSLSIQLLVTGLLPDDNTIGSELVFESNVSVRLLDAQ